MKYLYLSLLILITACGSKQESEPDNWETPTLFFKKSDQETSQKSVVTQSFKQNLTPADQFEFSFKGESALKQKSIANVRIKAKCGDNFELSNGVFEETYDLGARPIFSAHDLLPPQALLENSKTIFCKWTVTAINVYGSTRTYSLPPLRLDDDNSSTKIKIKTTEGREVTAGSVVNFENSKGMTFSPPDSGSFTSVLKCDLLSINLGPSNSIVGDFVVEESDNESLRLKHPMQRCLIEVKSNTGKIYRSGGFKFYLFPSELSVTQVNFLPHTSFEPIQGSMVIGTARIINNSDQIRTFGFQSSQPQYDIFFFDDHGFGGTMADDLPNSSYYWYQTKNDGKAWIQINHEFVDVAGQKLLVLQPHEDLKDVALRLDYSVNCGGGGEYSIGGLRVPQGKEIFGERAPYKDKRGNVIDLPISGTTLNTNSPAPYFLRFFHNKLVGNPKTYNRSWRPVSRGC